MNRISFFKVLLFSFHLILFVKPIQAQESSPNVLFIVADDLNASLNSYGKDGIVTPNLDRLAESGVKFERAYSQAPLCNPSRASMMTGKRPHNLGIWNNDPHFRGIYPSIKTIPQHFKNHGYHSVGIGKIYHNWGGQVLEGDPKSWSEPQVYHWGVHAWDRYVPGRPYKMYSDVARIAVQSEDVPDEAYLDGRITNAAINKLRELQETPFFLGVGFWKPHLPYNVPKKYWDLYDRENLPQVKYSEKVEGVPKIAYVDSHEGRSYGGVPKRGKISDSTKKELRHGYLAAISYVDAQVGKILAEVDRLGLTENTIIVFVSDHGYHAGEHGQFGKWTNFEVGARVPFIISAPGFTSEGKASQSIVESLDIFPTLIQLCNLPKPDGLDGISLVPILKNPNERVKSYALSQIARPLGGVDDLEIIGSSIRNEKFRYNIWVKKSTGNTVAEELYKLSEDIYNADNLIDDPQYMAVRDKLAQKLKQMLYE